MWIVDERTTRLPDHHAFLDTNESSRALAEVFRQQRQPLERFLLGLLRDRTDVDDALQEVFLKLVESWPSIRSETAKSWLFTVAYHEALDLRRRRKRQDAALVRLWERPAWADHRSSASGELEVQRREEIDAVRQALAKLPDEQRDVVQRRVYEDQNFADIAAELRCPLGTVLTRMRRALKALARTLKE